MTGYDIYIFILCLVVFIALTTFFGFLINYVIKLNTKLIKGGLYDESIIKEHQKRKTQSKALHYIDLGFTILFIVIALSAFSLSLYIRINENKPLTRSALKVVKSKSMASKDKNSKYLFDNNLNNQIEMFDIIKVEPLPKEENLKLFDIVVYEYEGEFILHRIIDIKYDETNIPHKEYILKGDANQYADKKPVVYSQMRSIYKGVRVPYIGSFIVFINSPAGYLCILLVILVTFGYPRVERKLIYLQNSRLYELGIIKEKPIEKKWFKKREKKKKS